MDQAQTQVKEFMEGCGQNVRSKPEAPSKEERILRVKLLLEEVLEFAEASGVDVTSGTFLYENDTISIKDLKFWADDYSDLVAVADGLADIRYVMNGAGCSYGMDLEKIGNVVHENNMLKIKNGTFGPDGKLIKPKDHPKPDIQSVLFPKS